MKKICLVLMFLVFVIGCVSGLGGGVSGFNEVKWDDGKLQFSNDVADFDFRVFRREGGSILNYFIFGDFSLAYPSMGNVVEEKECVSWSTNIVPTCLEYQDNIHFSFDVTLKNDENDTIRGVIFGELEDLNYDYTSGVNIIYSCDGFCYASIEYEFFEFQQNDYEERIIDIETEQEIQKNKILSFELWKDTITTQLSDILLSITGLVTRVEVLEEYPCNECNETSEEEVGAGTWSNFKDYISSSIRKKMVCGYAEENRLDSISELGYDCDLTYKTYSSGRERVRCKCRRN